MPSAQPKSTLPASRLSLILFLCFFLLVLIAGGASRADVLGQAFVRAVAWIVLLVYIFAGPRPRWERAPWVAAFIFAALGLLVIQLIPMPYEWWSALPGRGVVANGTSVAGLDRLWRPLSLSPAATGNAIASMVVPLLTLILVSAMGAAHQKKLIAVILSGTAFVAAVGMLQFAGARFDNPLINDVAGDVSGTLANRNHFALLAAIGCLLAPVWVFSENRGRRARALSALGITLVFILMILASGSRAGLILGLVGCVIGLVISFRPIARKLSGFRKSTVIAAASGVAAMYAGAVLLSIGLGRAVSVDRAISMQSGADLRVKALPTLLDMVEKYFPAGSGFGAFPLVYKIDEPDALLGPSYFNHAHNDFLEVAIDGGIMGVAILVAGLLWWLWQSFQVWNPKSGSSDILARTGSGVLLLILCASAIDYPARTPLIMVITVIAAIWLSNSAPRNEQESSARAQF